MFPDQLADGPSTPIPETSEFTDIWPNPRDPKFDTEKMLPTGIALSVYEAAYNKMTTIFTASAVNREGFDRRNIKSLLHIPSKPKPKGPKTSKKDLGSRL